MVVNCGKGAAIAPRAPSAESGERKLVLKTLGVRRTDRRKEHFEIVRIVELKFNQVLNRMQLPQSTTARVNFDSTPAKFTSGANAGLYSGGFGTIVPLSGTSGMRTGQLIGRITFCRITF